MNDGYIYSVKKTDDDALETLIEKSNIKADFTPRQMLNDQESARRVIKELKGKLDIETKKCDNIEHHHPFVKDMTLEQLYTCHMYYEAKALIDPIRGIPPKLKEVEDVLKESEEEFIHIAKELDLDILPTQEEVVEEAVAKIVD